MMNKKKPTLKNKKIAVMHQLHLTIYLLNTSIPVIELYLYITKKLKFPILRKEIFHVHYLHSKS